MTEYAITPDMTFDEKVKALADIVAIMRLEKMTEFFADMLDRPNRKAYLGTTMEVRRAVLATAIKDKIVEVTEYDGLKRGLHWPKGLLATEWDLRDHGLDPATL